MGLPGWIKRLIARVWFSLQKHLYRKRENFSLFQGGKIAEVLILPSFMTHVSIYVSYFFWRMMILCSLYYYWFRCGLWSHYLFIYLFWCHFVSIYVHVLWINQKLCSWTNCGHINYCLCHYVSLNVHLQWQVFLLQFFWALNLGV